MPLRDLLKKKDRIEHNETPIPPSSLPQASEFTFMRTDTNIQEPIALPTFSQDRDIQDEKKDEQTSPRKHLFRRSHKVSPSRESADPSSPPPKDRKRFSQRLGLKDRSASTSSIHLPSDLPTIQYAYSDQGNTEETEAQWEERATRLASKSPSVGARSPTTELQNLSLGDAPGSRSPSRPRSVSDAKSDVNIQEAIRLHESGSLEAATDMFRQLAETGNVLSQVLYGLSLRHGWGCTPDPERAVTFLSEAASNSAEIESQALQAGMKKGGAAKGELVLAIFELANCFRHGWGVAVDKAAARQYYETAANLGDTDAMNEAAWCYLEGFGGKKDKVSASPFLMHMPRKRRPYPGPQAATLHVILSLININARKLDCYSNLVLRPGTTSLLPSQSIPPPRYKGKTISIQHPFVRCITLGSNADGLRPTTFPPMAVWVLYLALALPSETLAFGKWLPRLSEKFPPSPMKFSDR